MNVGLPRGDLIDNENSRLLRCIPILDKARRSIHLICVRDTVQCPPKVAASGGLLRDYVMDAGYE